MTAKKSPLSKIESLQTEIPPLPIRDLKAVREREFVHGEKTYTVDDNQATVLSTKMLLVKEKEDGTSSN